MNTTRKMILAAVASNLVTSVAMAGNFYAGAEVGGSTVPNLEGSVAQTMSASGYSSVTVSQNKSGGLAAIFAGQWVTSSFGWEAGLVGFSSIKGRVAATNGTSTIFPSYRYSSGALSFAAMGGIDVASKGKIFFKAGAYGASVTLDGPTSTVSTSSAGPVIGAGFSYDVIKHLVARVEVNNFVGVKYPNYEFFTPANSSTKTNITTLAIGAAYEF